MTYTKVVLVPGMATGWFGIPGEYASRSTKVHVIKHGAPICGSRIGKRQRFQWCSGGIQRTYIECLRCLKIADGVLETLN